MPDTASRERENLIAELRRLYACMRPPRMRGMGRLMELDLTIPQLKVMFLLLDSEPARMSFVAQRMEITLPAATHVIDRLVSAGFVERGEDPDDRRVVQCSLTGLGRETLDKLCQQMPFEQDEFIERLSNEELKVCVQAAQIFQRVTAEIDS